MWSLRDPNARKTTAANIFIKVRPQATRDTRHPLLAPALRTRRCGEAHNARVCVRL